MATKLKKTIGTLGCLCCGYTMPVKQADNGTIDLSCKDCDLSAYAKAGTDANRRMLARMTRREMPEDAGHKPSPVAQAVAQVVAKPAPAAQTPAPAPAKKRASFFPV